MSEQNNQGRRYYNHEESMGLLNGGFIEISPSQSSIQQRIQKYGGGQGSYNPQYTNNVGGEATQSNMSLPPQSAGGYGDGGSSYGAQAGGQAGGNFSGQAGVQAGGNFGGQAGSSSYQTQNGVPQLSYEQLQREYMERFPRAYGVPVVAVKKDGRGVIQAFKLQNGHVLDYSQMIQAAFDRQLQGIEVQNNREGELILRSSPDGFRSNNLDQLPTFE